MLPLQLCSRFQAPKLLFFIGIASLSLFAAESKAPDTTAALLDASKVWTIHLTFSADQWQAMEPKGGPPAGGPGGPGRMGGMGGRGGPGGMRGPGGRGPFSPAMMIAPAFLKGDKNGDGKLSREEFQALGEDWFTAWDKPKQGKLTEDQIRAGIGAGIQPAGAPVRCLSTGAAPVADRALEGVPAWGCRAKTGATACRR